MRAADSWPTSGPIFNLPPGITCDSVPLNIVDNHWPGASCLVTPCDPDFYADGSVDQDDLDYLIDVVAGGACP